MELLETIMPRLVSEGRKPWKFTIKDLSFSKITARAERALSSMSKVCLDLHLDSTFRCDIFLYVDGNLEDCISGLWNENPTIGKLFEPEMRQYLEDHRARTRKKLGDWS